MNRTRASALRSVVALAAALAATLTASGCTSSRHPVGHATSPTDTGRPSPSHARSAKGLPPGVVGATNIPAKVANRPALRADVGLATCSPRPHGWQASGSARNPGKKPATYKITVFFTSNQATVIGTARTSVRVLPGRSRRWTASSTFHPAKPTLCVLRGVG